MWCDTTTLQLSTIIYRPENIDVTPPPPPPAWGGGNLGGSMLLGSQNPDPILRRKMS